MKTTQVFLSLCATLVLVTFAHSESSAQQPLRVLYNPQIPSQVLKSARTKESTRFYGNAIVNRQNWGFHFYDLQQFKKMDSDRAIQNSQLDLFIQKQNGKHTIFERVQRIPITYERWPFGKLKFQMDMLWLDSELKTIPILKIALDTRISSGGMDGKDVFCIFPKGLKGNATIQQFPFYYYEGPTGASSNHFDQVDKNGFLTIFQQYTGNTGIDYTGWKWNGSRFTKTQELHVDHEFLNAINGMEKNY